MEEKYGLLCFNCFFQHFEQQNEKVISASLADSILGWVYDCGLQPIGILCDVQHDHWRKIHGNKLGI